MRTKTKPNLPGLDSPDESFEPEVGQQLADDSLNVTWGA